MPGFLSFRAFGFAAAERTQKKGAFCFISLSTAFQEKFRTLSFVVDLSIEGLAFVHRFLHSFEMSEQTRSSMVFLRLGLSITASARALKLLPLASAFPSRWSSFGKSPVFRPDSYVTVAYKNKKQLVYIEAVKPTSTSLQNVNTTTRYLDLTNISIAFAV